VKKDKLTWQKILQTVLYLLVVLAAENNNLNIQYTLKLLANVCFIEKYVLKLIILIAMLVLYYSSITFIDDFQVIFGRRNIMSLHAYLKEITNKLCKSNFPILVKKEERK